MSELEFWNNLEYRLWREFRGLQDGHHRFLWCDGFDSLVYLFDDSEPRINGQLEIHGGPGPSMWDFTLFLPQRYARYDEIDWASLIPPDNVTRWLAIDAQRRRIEMDPVAAVPDIDVAVSDRSRTQ